MSGKRFFVWLTALTAVAVAAVSAPTASADQPGYRVPGVFDLEKARAERQALVEELLSEMPRGAREDRVVIEVTEEEKAPIAEFEQRLRVGIVKNLGKPILYREQHGLHGAGPVGVLERNDRGSVWATTLSAPGATALRVHFTGFDLAPGAQLYLHTEEGEAFGPYTGRGYLDSGEFWSHTIAGDTVTVQVREGSGRSAFSISEIGYVDLSKVPGLPMPDPQTGEQLCTSNAECVENVSCNAIPEDIESARAAYAHMEFVSGPYLYYCTGGLVADTVTTSSIPYFLTANHCIDSATEASSLQAFFQYTVGCNQNCPALYFYNKSTPYPRTVGATIKKTNRTSDYTLLQLSQSAPDGSAFLGWTKDPVAKLNDVELYRISHPQGAPQAYSTHVVDTKKPTCRSWPRGAWIYSRDVLGATEGGSSGSPVLNDQGQVVGQLSGACGYKVNDVCDELSNATVDGAFANYYCEVQPFLAPTDTSCGGGGGGIDPPPPACFETGLSCTSNFECCSGSCKGKPGGKTCK